jgi:hypothetical protein
MTGPTLNAVMESAANVLLAFTCVAKVEAMELSVSPLATV